MLTQTFLPNGSFVNPFGNFTLTNAGVAPLEVCDYDGLSLIIIPPSESTILTVKDPVRSRATLRPGVK